MPASEAPRAKPVAPSTAPVERNPERESPAKAGLQSKSREITEGVVLDYDAEGNLVDIDIDNASQKVGLKKLTLNKLPVILQINPD